MVRRAVPSRGDIVWMNFDPHAGKEMGKHRPALVLSPASYNKGGVALICPITSKIKGHPWEVVLPGGLAVSGAILSDQIKSLDWRARNATHEDHVPAEVIDEVIAKIAPLLGL